MTDAELLAAMHWSALSSIKTPPRTERRTAMLTIIRDVSIIAWLLVGIVPQAQAWYQVQVDNYYEGYYK